MYLIILTLTKKSKKPRIYRPGNHLQASGFTFKSKTEKETYNVKLTEKLDFVKQTYNSDASKYDSKSIYRDINVIFILADGQFYGSKTGFAEP